MKIKFRVELLKYLFLNRNKTSNRIVCRIFDLYNKNKKSNILHRRCLHLLQGDGAHLELNLIYQSYQNYTK